MGCSHIVSLVDACVMNLFVQKRGQEDEYTCLYHTDL